MLCPRFCSVPPDRLIGNFKSLVVVKSVFIIGKSDMGKRISTVFQSS
jgi:hypothetical protein